MFGFDSFNLINEFERVSNELNAEQLTSSSTRLQPYFQVMFVVNNQYCSLSPKRIIDMCRR